MQLIYPFSDLDFLLLAAAFVIVLLLLVINRKKRQLSVLEKIPLPLESSPEEPKQEIIEPLKTRVEEISAREPEIVQAPKKQNKLLATSGRLFSGLRGLFSGGETKQDSIYKELERSLIEGDVGVLATEKLLSGLKDSLGDSSRTLSDIEVELKSKMLLVFDSQDGASITLKSKPTVLILVGVNGVGKTTTAGKLAQKYSEDGNKVLLGACDTFRAAAVSQLQIWGERSNVEVVSGTENMKPSTVAYNACKRAKETDVDLLILDTAGRLHNKKNLMDELGGVIKIIAKELPEASVEIFLVVDSTSGQNALEQARAFKEICNLTGIIVTKLDGSPRGGMLFAIRSELGIPVRYIGLGEGVEDLESFRPEWFVEELFGT